MARFGVGLVADADLGRAAEQAARAAIAPLAGRTPDLVCVFVCAPSPEDAEIAGARVADVTGAKSLLGCTAGGVIGGGRGLEGVSSVSVWAAVLPGVRVRTFHLEVMRAPDSLAVVGLPDHPDEAQACVLLADPYSFPAEGFVDKFNDTVAGLPLVGGMATGPLGPGSTRLFLKGTALGRGAVGALLEGPVAARTVVSQGCRPIGPSMVVTKGAGNVVHELAGMPAVRKLEEVLRGLPPEDQALATTGLHIGVVMDEYADEHERGDFLVRGVLGVDPDSEGLVVGELVEVGRTVRFHVRDARTANEDLRGLLTLARRERVLDHVEGALLFSCNGRGASLFPSADHDPAIVGGLLDDVPVAGFFANGEIGPVGGRNYLHGFTASVLALGAPEPDGED